MLFRSTASATPGADPKFATSYERHKSRAALRQRRISATGREIGELPAVVDPARRARAGVDLEFALTTYFPRAFPMPFCDDHRQLISDLSSIIRYGGQKAVAMPRGSGKTTIFERAAIIAALFGYRRFLALLGANKPKAKKSFNTIKTEIETNELLLEDFPEVCYPVRKLEGIAQRGAGQLYRGLRTYIQWTGQTLVLPTIPDSPASGCVLTSDGLLSAIRGMNFTRPDGAPVRPSLVLLDDPQTDKSARSEGQTDERENLVNGAVMGMAGPGEKMSCLCACTVICENDLSDRMLDPKRSPQWQPMKTKMVRAWPNEDGQILWEQYRDLRNAPGNRDAALQAANAFYQNNRAAMDAGASVSWPERFEPGELSALQHAYNLRFDRGERAFGCEFQNEPPKAEIRAHDLTPSQIQARTNGIARRIVPADCDTLTAFIDVQQDVLFWLAAAWRPGFGGSIVDYGAWPSQRAAYWTKSTIRKTLTQATGLPVLDDAIYAALESLVSEINGRPFVRQDGSEIPPGRILIDANWNKSTDAVYRFCRESKWKSVCMPSHGRYVGAARKPMTDYTAKPGEKIGHHWMVASNRNHRGLRYVLIDTNFWKSAVTDRLAAPLASASALKLFGGSRDDHRMLSDHLTAEFRVRVEVKGGGRSVDEWSQKPDRPDNDWFDCLVGAAVGASMLGVKPYEQGDATTTQTARTRRRCKF